MKLLYSLLFTIGLVSNVLGVDISPSGPISICKGGSVTLTASPAGAIVWYKDGSEIAGQTASTLDVSESGTYDVYVDGVQSDNTVTVTVEQPAIISTLPAVVCKDVETDFQVGFTPFSCLGANVRVRITLADPSQNTDFELYYKEILDNNYYPLAFDGSGVAWFGPAGGFPLSNITSDFRIKGLNETTIAFTVEIVTEPGGVILASEAESVTIAAWPTVNFDPVAAVCLSTTPFDLSTYVSPAGGAFFGAGISGETFSPLVAGVGPENITYVYNDANGCQSSATQTITINADPAKPTVTPSGVTTFCEGGSVDLTASAASAWLWSTGETTQTITVTTSDNYTVTITEGSCTATSDAISVTVHSKPVVTVTSQPTAACSPNVVDLTTAVLSDNTNVEWWSDIAATVAVVDPTQVAAGTYYVTVTDANGCKSNASELTAIVHALPTATLTGATTICEGSATNLTVTFTGTGPFDFTYTDGTTPETYTDVASPYVFSVSPSTSTTYNISAVNDAHCVGTDLGSPVTITVNPKPVVSLDAFSAVCIDQAPFALSGGLPAGGTYSGAGVSGGSFNPSTAGAGNHTITYSYTDANGCTNTATRQLTVNALPIVSLSDFTAVCVGTPLFALSGGFPVGGVYSGTGVDGSGNFDPSVAGVGSHLITYTYTGATGCVATISKSITVNALPVLVVGDITGNRTVCKNTTESYAAPAGFASYTWTITGGSVTSGDGTNAIDVLWDDNHDPRSIELTITDANGCSATVTDVIATVALPADPIAFTSSQTKVCPGTTGVTFSIDPIAGAIDYEWTVTTGASIASGQGTTSVILDFAADAPYMVTVSVTPKNSCGEASAIPLSQQVKVSRKRLYARSSGDFTSIEWNDRPDGTGTPYTYNVADASNYTFCIQGVSVAVNAPVTIGGIRVEDEFSLSQLSINNPITFNGCQLDTFLIGTNGLVTLSELLSASSGSDWFIMSGGELQIHLPAGNPDYLSDFEQKQITGGVINYAQTSNQDIATYAYYHLKLSGSGNKALTDAITVAGDLTIDNGSVTLDIQSNDAHIDLKGNWINNGGNYQSNAYLDVAVRLTDKTKNQIISGVNTFNRLEIDKLSNLYVQLSTGVASNLYIQKELRFVGRGVLKLNNNNVVLHPGARVIDGIGNNTTFDAGRMIEIDGTDIAGTLIKELTYAADFDVNPLDDYAAIFPIGTDGKYAPFYVANLRVDPFVGVQTLSGVTRTFTSVATDIVKREWKLSTTLSAIQAAALAFEYNSDERNGSPSRVTLDGATVLNGSSDLIYNKFEVPSSNIAISGVWQCDGGSVSKKTVYSYQSGPWEVNTTWTTDPAGLIPSHVLPADIDDVVILSDDEVTLNTPGTIVSSVEIRERGVLDINTTTGHTFGRIAGKGLLRLATATLPSANYDGFVAKNTGTIEYSDYGVGVSLSLPNSTTLNNRNQYNNLIISGTGTKQLAGAATYTINGNLTVRGTDVADGLRIGTTANAAVTINLEGNLTVETGRVDLGTGTTAHHLYIKGDLTNNGIIRFTGSTATYPTLASTDAAINTFYTRNIATESKLECHFTNATANQTVQCNGTTDFYRFEMNKGIDDTYRLNVFSSAEANFRLWARNDQADSGADNVPQVTQQKALSLQYGTLVLNDNIRILSLTEGTNFRINQYATLIVNGANIRVSTCVGGTGSRCIVFYGKFFMEKGDVNFDRSAGIVLRSTGSYTQNGGTVRATQLRPSVTSTEHRGSVYMNGGVLTLDEYHTGTAGETGGNSALFCIPYANQVFQMTGGVINVYNSIGTSATTGALHIGIASNNYLITGGTFNFYLTRARDFNFTSTVPFYNLKMYRTINTNVLKITNLDANPGGDVISTAALPLVVLNDFTLVDSVNQARFTATNQNVFIRRNFTMQNGTVYTPGTNTTYFDGSAALQTLTANANVAFNNLTISNSAALGQVRLDGTANISVVGTLNLLQGTLNDNGKTLTVNGYVVNESVHIGTGKIVLSGGATQHQLGGNGLGEFANLELNDTRGALFTCNQTIKGVLTLTTGILSIAQYKCSLYADVAGAGFGAAKMIATTGNKSDAGLERVFGVSEVSKTNNLLPIGTGTRYLPISLSYAAGEGGVFTVRPVNAMHPYRDNDNVITAYWKINASGFNALTSFQYDFTHDGAASNATWMSGRITESDDAWALQPRTLAGNQFRFFGTTVLDMNGEFTLGLGDTATPALGYVTVYESRQNGDWQTPATWRRRKGVTIEEPSPTKPGANAKVTIRNPHNVYMDPTTTTGNETVGSLNIQNGAVFDLRTTSSVRTLNFGSLVNVTGTGTLRLSSSGATAQFPGGDFGNFLGTAGGSVEYYYTANNFMLPSPPNTYYNLKLIPEAGTIVLPASPVTVYNHLTVSDSLTNGAGAVVINPTVNDNTLTVNGNIRVTKYASLNLHTGGSRSVVAKGNITVDNNGKVVTASGALNTSTNASYSYTFDADLQSWANQGGGTTAYEGTLDAISYTKSNTANRGVAHSLPGTLATYSSISFSMRRATAGGYANPISIRLYVGATTYDVGTVDVNLSTAYSNYTVNLTGVNARLYDKIAILYPGGDNNMIFYIDNIVINGALLQNLTPLAAGTNSLMVNGNITNNSTFDLYDAANGVYNATIQGGVNSSITGAGATTEFNRLTVAKTGGRDVQVEVTSSNFTLAGATNTATKPLDLQSGTFNYNTNQPITLTSGGGDFNIPAGSQLWLQQGTATVSGAATGIELGGKLRVDGSANLAAYTNNVNNYIEYSSIGTPEMEVGGSAVVSIGSQLRRSPDSDNGSLIYSQSGTSSVTVGQAGVPNNNIWIQKFGASNRGVFEILSGGQFNFSSGTLTIAHSSGSPVPDVLIETTNGSVDKNASIIIGNAGNNAGHSVTLKTDMPLGNLTVVQRNIASVLVKPLVLQGNATIENTATLLMNNKDLTVGGNFTATGTYTHGTNTTIFNGSSDQDITGTTLSFEALTIDKSSGEARLNSPVTSVKTLTIDQGILNDNNYVVNLKGNAENNGGVHRSPGAAGRIIFNGLVQQTIGGTGGQWGSLELNNSQNIQMISAQQINNTLLLTQGLLDIASQRLTLGSAFSIGASTPSATAMIKTNGLEADQGIRLLISPGAYSYTLPIGSASRYTPATYSGNSTTSGYIEVKPVNQAHYALTGGASANIDYYWIVRSSNIVDVVTHSYDYTPCTIWGTESQYVTARFYGASWETATGSVNTANNVFSFANALPVDGEYTLGQTEKFVLVAEDFYSIKDGLWTDITTWNIPSIPKSTSNVHIRHNVDVKTEQRYALSVDIEPAGVLKVFNPTWGHKFSIVTGTGKFIMDRVSFPNGDFSAFVSSTGGTIEYQGSGYIVQNPNTGFNHVIFNPGAAGTLNMPSSSYTIYGNMTIESGTLNASADNVNLRVRGNFVNKGTFNGSSSSVVFEGSAEQRLEGIGSTTFNQLVINKALGSLTLDQSIAITTRATFTKGIVKVPDAYQVNFSATATMASASAASFVEGRVTKQSSGTGFTFPVGRGVLYRPVTASAYSGSYSVEYFNSTYNEYAVADNTPPIHVSPFEHWNITRAGTESADFTFTWTDDLIPVSDDLTKLRMAYFDTNDSQWHIFPQTDITIAPSSTLASGSLVLRNPVPYGRIAMATLEPPKLHCPGTTPAFNALTVSGGGVTYEWALSDNIATVSLSNGNKTATLNFHGNLEDDAELSLIVRRNGAIVSRKVYWLTTFPKNIEPYWPTGFCLGESTTLNGPIDIDATDFESYEWKRNGAALTGTLKQLTINQAGTYQLRVQKTVPGIGSCWSNPYSKFIEGKVVTPGGIFRVQP